MNIVLVAQGDLPWVDFTVVNGITEQKRIHGSVEKDKAADMVASDKLKNMQTTSLSRNIFFWQLPCTRLEPVSGSN